MSTPVNGHPEKIKSNKTDDERERKEVGTGSEIM